MRNVATGLFGLLILTLVAGQDPVRSFLDAGRETGNWSALLDVGELLTGQDRDYKKSAEKIKIIVESKVRDQAKADDQWKQVVEWLENKENWEKMFKRNDDQLGIYRPEGISISVTLKGTQFENKWTVARGKANQGSGEMEIAVPTVVEFTKVVLENWKKQTTLAQVTEMFVTHELTHCLQQTASGEKLIDKWPLWIIEGMGCFSAEDDLQDDQLKMLKQIGIQDLDAIKGPAAYPRGRIFFKFFNEKYGSDKLKEFVDLIFKKTAIKQAVEKVTKKKWDAFKKEELEWAKKFAKEKGV